jgi:hypothetical protein
MATTKKPSAPRRKAPTKTSAGTTPADAVEQGGGETGASPSAASGGLGAAPDMQPAESAEGPAYGADMREAIAQRAYDLWERAGRPEGRHDEHWEQAEREVRAETSGRKGR